MVWAIPSGAHGLSLTVLRSNPWWCSGDDMQCLGFEQDLLWKQLHARQSGTLTWVPSLISQAPASLHFFHNQNSFPFWPQWLLSKWALQPCLVCSRRISGRWQLEISYLVIYGPKHHLLLLVGRLLPSRLGATKAMLSSYTWKALCTATWATSSDPKHHFLKIN